MVRLLLKKTLRDLHRGLATYLICIVVVAMGFAGYCVMSVASDHLTASQAYLYRESRFSEVFVKVYEAPKAAERELEKIVGVREANGRLVETVRVSGLREKEREVELQLISTQEGGLNFPLIYQGTAAGSDRREAVIGDAFMKAWKLKPGDTLTLLIRGQEVPVEVAGSGISPENIYMVKSIVDMLPDPYSYDAAFLSYEQLGQILGKEGRANDFVLTLDPGVQLSDVKDEIEEVLKPYGCYSVVDRSEQVSASLLDSELTQIGRMSKVVPFMFLFVAAIILYISLNRLISQQRVQVGTLMALGFSRKR